MSNTLVLNITELSLYNSDNPSTQHTIQLVQYMHTTRYITNFKTANTALDLLTSYNDFNKFQTLCNQPTQLNHTSHENATLNYINRVNTALSYLNQTMALNSF